MNFLFPLKHALFSILAANGKALVAPLRFCFALFSVSRIRFVGQRNVRLRRASAALGSSASPARGSSFAACATRRAQFRF